MRRWILLPILLIGLGLAAETVRLLESLEPLPYHKEAEGYSVEGMVYRFENEHVAVEAEHLTTEQRGAYYDARKLDDPFVGLVEYDNLFVLRVRIENLHKSETLNMQPSTVSIGNCLVQDETHVYQLFYRMKDGDERLAAAGKTLFLRPLSLPPGTWIERLFLFHYDDPYSVRRLILVISNIMFGNDMVEVEFRFKSRFKKVKR